MPLTNAEKQKQYRERMRLQNPEKYEIFKKKNAERNQKRKKIKDFDEAGKAEEREKWKYRKKKQNDKGIIKVINEENVQNYEETNSGSVNLETVVCDTRLAEENMENNEEENTGSENLETLVRKARLAERRKMQRQWADESTNYKDKIKMQKKKIKTLQKKVNRYRKQKERLMETIDQIMKKYELLSQENTTLNINTQTPNNLTPASKTNNFIEKNLPDISDEMKEKVKKQLLTHNVLVTSLQSSYKSATTDTERDILKKAVNNDITRKYKSNSRMARVIGLKGKIRRTIDRRTKNKKNTTTINQIKRFYERDDVSKATSGKKECKTFKKNKQQIRYLHNTLTELYKKYRNEGGTAKLTTFKKYRPFYVRSPNITNRNTCACVKHENIWLKCSKLKSMGMIEAKYCASHDPNKIIDAITSEFACDMKTKDCAYGDCDICKNKKINLRWEGIDPARNISWEEWQNEKHEYKDKSDKIKVTKKIVKSEKNATVQELTEKFNEEMRKIKKHIFNIKHQYRQASDCLKTLSDTEVAMIIDFSENWVCKLTTEVQSMHFGASKTQITIHTGVLYTKDKDPKAFATLSPSNEHGPEAIWAHLGPVLKYIKIEYPNVTTIHFFSDGPCTQYRQKKNFYLFTKTTKELGFPHSTWNFSESSHGKGAADGVGAAIKRKLDNYVSHGIDIPNALVAFNTLQESDTSVMIHYISENEIGKNKLPADLKPIPKTMEVHQVTNTEIENVIAYRCLSCFCTRPVNCKCLDLKTHLLLPLPDFVETDSTVNNDLQSISYSTEIPPIIKVEADVICGNLKRKRQSKKEVKIRKKVKGRKIDLSESSDSDEEVIDYIETDDDMDDFLSDNSDSVPPTNLKDSESFILDENTGIFVKEIPSNLGTKELNTDYIQHQENISPNVPGSSRIKILEDRPIVEGKYVLVKFQTNKTFKYYVGQILAITEKLNVKIKFMRFKKSIGVFYWPQVEDISDMCFFDITKVLSDPINYRRGMLQFHDDLNKFNIN